MPLLVSDIFAGSDLPGAEGSNKTSSVTETFNIYKNEYWKEGFKNKAWEVKYTGYGMAGIEKGNDNVIFAFPQASVSANETHSSLILSTGSFENIELDLKVNTLKQLRENAPNPWETAWILWNYTDDTHFYYFILKPNGWELGKEDPQYPGAQRFLATGEAPFLTIQAWSSVNVKQTGNVLEVYVDGVLVVKYADNESPYFSGKAGLYCEDSYVQFDDIKITSH